MQKHYQTANVTANSNEEYTNERNAPSGPHRSRKTLRKHTTRASKHIWAEQLFVSALTGNKNLNHCLTWKQTKPELSASQAPATSNLNLLQLVGFQ